MASQPPEGLPAPSSPSSLAVSVASPQSRPARKVSSRAAKPNWQPAIDYNVRNLPSVKNNKTHVRELLPFNSRTGRLCDDNECNRCCDPCGEGVVSAFVPFGSAMTSYFKLLKGFYVIFFILACLAIPAVVINTFGVTAAGQQAQILAIAVTTIGNLPTAAVLGNMTDPTITLPYTGTEMGVPEAAAIYAGLDFVAVVCFLLFVSSLRGAHASLLGAHARSAAPCARARRTPL
jgi:hypothetical protein